MNIRFVPRGIKEVQEYLKTIPRGVKKYGLKAYTEYQIGTQAHGLRHYSPYRHVSYKRAYGGFKSDKQRKYVMAMIREGRIAPGTPHRTGQGQRGWAMTETQRGYTIKNPEKSMFFSMSNTGQANLNRLAGWRTVSDSVADNHAGAMRAANADVKAFLGRKG